MYNLLRDEARRHRRSLSQQALTALARGLQAELEPKARRQRILGNPGRLDPALTARLPDPAKLLREDRRR